MLPRTYQKQAVDAISEALKSHSKVGAVLPTGSGKSLVETMVIDRLVDELRFNECVIVACHLADVVDQLHLSYCKHGRYGRQAMRFSSRQKPRMTTKVIFTTVQSLTSSGARKYWSQDPMRKDVKAVIIDEAHQFGTDSYQILAEDLFPFAKYVGFSATPYRKNQYSFAQFDTLAYSISSEALIKEGFLVPPRLFALNMQGMEPAERLASIVRIWKEKEMSRGFVSVVYLRSKLEAQEMRLIAEEAKIRVEFVSGEDSETYCRQLYQKAKDGEVEMICNVRKLETGVDIPNIGAIFMPYGTHSVVTYLQRIGRGLRPFKGKTECNVYVFGDAPSIESGKWQRIQRDALSAKDPMDPLQTLEDDLVDLIEDGAPAARIAWTQEAIRACQLLIDSNMKTVAELIAEKRFPDKYAKALAKLTPMIKSSNPDPEPVPISEAQISVLTQRHRFRGQDIARLSSGEAGAILSALDRYYSRDPFILQTGPHAGKHIADTPPMYRRYLKEPANRSLWQRWIRAGRPKGENDAT